jgi:hypothetical protein
MSFSARTNKPRAGRSHKLKSAKKAERKTPAQKKKNAPKPDDVSLATFASQDTYIAHLETNLERVATACLSVRTMNKQVTALAQQGTTLDTKIQGITQLLGLSRTMADQQNSEYDKQFSHVQASLKAVVEQVPTVDYIRAVCSETAQRACASTETRNEDALAQQKEQYETKLEALEKKMEALYDFANTTAQMVKPLQEKVHLLTEQQQAQEAEIIAVTQANEAHKADNKALQSEVDALRDDYQELQSKHLQTHELLVSSHTKAAENTRTVALTLRDMVSKSSQQADARIQSCEDSCISLVKELAVKLGESQQATASTVNTLQIDLTSHVRDSTAALSDFQRELMASLFGKTDLSVEPVPEEAEDVKQLTLTLDDSSDDLLDSSMQLSTQVNLEQLVQSMRDIESSLSRTVLAEAARKPARKTKSKRKKHRIPHAPELPPAH